MKTLVLIISTILSLSILGQEHKELGVTANPEGYTLKKVQRNIDWNLIDEKFEESVVSYYNDSYFKYPSAESSVLIDLNFIDRDITDTTKSNLQEFIAYKFFQSPALSVFNMKPGQAACTVRYKLVSDLEKRTIKLKLTTKVQGQPGSQDTNDSDIRECYKKLIPKIKKGTGDTLTTYYRELDLNMNDKLKINQSDRTSNAKPTANKLNESKALKITKR